MKRNREIEFDAPGAAPGSDLYFPFHPVEIRDLTPGLRLENRDLTPGMLGAAPGGHAGASNRGPADVAEPVVRHLGGGDARARRRRDDGHLHRRRRRAAQALAVPRPWRAGAGDRRLHRARCPRCRTVAARAPGLRDAVGRLRVDCRHLAGDGEPDRFGSARAGRDAAGERQLLRPPRRHPRARPHLLDPRRDPRHCDRSGDQRWPMAARLRRRPAGAWPQAPHRRGRLRNHRGDARVVPASQSDPGDRRRRVGAERLARRPVQHAVLQRAVHAVGDRPAVARSDRGPGARPGREPLGRDAARPSRSVSGATRVDAAPLPARGRSRLGGPPGAAGADVRHRVRDADRHLQHLQPPADPRGRARARGRRAAGARRVAMADRLECPHGGRRAGAGGRRDGLPREPVGCRSPAQAGARSATAGRGNRGRPSRVPVRRPDRDSRRPAGRARSRPAVGPIRRQRASQVVRQGRAQRRPGAPPQRAGRRAGGDRPRSSSPAPVCWCAASGTCNRCRPASRWTRC